MVSSIGPYSGCSFFRADMAMRHLRHDVQGILVPLQIEGDAADAGLFPQQVLIHIVPILPVMLQKILEIRFIVDDDAG